MAPSLFSSEHLADAQAQLDRLIAAHKPGHALQREFQTDPGIYRLDLERIWRRGWLFAGHTCQVKSPGDYFVFDIDTDSLVVIRGDDGEIHAFHNTCRHRGMRVCQEESGHVGRIVCPYHQWTYARNGELLACGGMDRDGDLDRSEFGLHPAHVREVAGLIFVCLAEDPIAFEGAGQSFAAMLRPQGLERAKVAGFTQPYLEFGTVPVLRKKNADRFKSWADIDQKGVTVVTTLGTVFDAQAREYFKVATLRQVEAPALGFQEVLSGRADVTITSNVDAAALVRRYPDLTVAPVDRPRGRRPASFLMPQNDQVWLNYMNNWITIKRMLGFFDELDKKWLQVSD